MKLQVQELQNVSFEVIIADDGSTSETRELIKQLSPQLNFPVQHLWQTDEGFRAAMARNRALAVAQGEYIIFMDGGVIVEQGSPEQLFRDPQHERTRSFLQQIRSV